MARLNSRRKRAAKLRQALTELAKARNPSTVADTGFVRSSNKAAKLNEHGGIAYSNRAPRPPLWEGKGTAKAKAPKRYTLDGIKSEPLASTDPLVHGDSLRDHYRRTWKGGRPIKKDQDDT